MDQQQFLLQPGYVLHLRAYGENHAIVELFVRDAGRVGVVARGVRSPKSRRRALLQPFSGLLLSWKSRGELGLLTDVEAGPRQPRLSGRGLLSGFYLNEVLMRLLRRDDPHPELYDQYRRALQRLAADEDEGAVLRVFEKHLLAELGYGLQLEFDVRGEPVVGDQEYDYRAEEGPVPVAEGTARLPVHGDTLLALAAEAFSTTRQKQESKRLMRQALAPHLGDRPLKSRELYSRRQSAGPGIEGQDGNDSA